MNAFSTHPLRSVVLCSVCALMLVTAGCSARQTERGVKGGAIGAGVGLVGAAIVDGSLGKGALVGGLVGAGVGVLTAD